MRARISEEALAELRDAAAWYEARARMGRALRDEVRRSVRRIADAPNTFPLVEGSTVVRRVLVHRFPYALLYVVRADGSAFVVAAPHLRSDPSQWPR